MKIYKDIVSGDEVLCDNDRPLKEEDGVVYVIEGKYIEIGGEDYGVASNADADADEGAAGEGTESQKQRVVDIVHQNRLVETQYDKKSYLAHIKGYMKVLKERLEGEPEKCAAFQAGATAFVKRVVGEFDDYQFFLGPSMGDEGIVILCKWEGEKAIFYYWKDGLKGEKV